MDLMKKIGKTVISVIILISFTSCCLVDRCSPLEIKLKEICVKADTIYCFPLNSLLDFEWEELYIISGPRFPDEIEEIIGIKYNKVIPDNYRQYIYLKNGKLIKEYRTSCRYINLMMYNENGYTMYNSSSVINIETRLIDEEWLYLHSIR
jgi:hypothetical protein